MKKNNSSIVAKAAIKMSISSREEEKKLQEHYKKSNILTTAVDVGGNINDSITKIIERALVASKRCGLVSDCHVHDGAVVGAAREALLEVSSKANGLNVGGKIGIARSGEHICVCIFMNIGLLHLDEIVIGLAHRSISNS
ncbi:HutP [Clostridium acetireducens DSM 10703]|uniref:Hut operon positive regulatory protein n=1 Tax=Clostridium acetireducens DSM 10703 TaxID=1121290 RepID=A0A1E8EZZ8_9CLOT|nr:HutP family protein [Clostridium acetireducens]OFI06723.1 HutP [Clostridium acetireducens DSM 10703]